MEAIGKQRFVVLDALRGLAAILVAIYHFHGEWIQGFDFWRGHLAVDFFFVLSGFVIAHTYIYGRDNVSTFSFVWRRIVRLYPLHIFSLLAFLGAALLVWHELPEFEHGPLVLLLQEFTLTQNVGFNAELTYNYPNWSVSVEFWVSVVLFLLISKRTSSYLLALPACAGLFLIYLNSPNLDADSIDFYTYVNGGLVRGAASFLLGVLAYRLFLRVDFKAVPTGYIEPLLAGVILAIIFVGTAAYGKIDFIAPFVFMLAVAVFAREQGLISHLLSKLSYLGTISYSIYLNQVAVAILFSHYVKEGFAITNELFALAMYLAGLLVFSHFTYLYVERPSRTWGRKLFSPRRALAGVHPIAASASQA